MVECVRRALVDGSKISALVVAWRTGGVRLARRDAVHDVTFKAIDARVRTFLEKLGEASGRAGSVTQ